MAVFFIEPLEKNQEALGYDVYSNPLRQKAIERTRDTGLISTTAPITLLQEQGTQLGFLVFRPMYRKGMPATSVAERRAALHSFAVGVFRIGDLVEAGPAKWQSEDENHQTLSSMPPPARSNCSTPTRWTWPPRSRTSLPPPPACRTGYTTPSRSRWGAAPGSWSTVWHPANSWRRGPGTRGWPCWPAWPSRY
ncbi:MAG: CHASE domain-containing protein [Candidatus Handelsmanbacteria bacterium]|nr:CHASE domain-containing protein [Candidatus Handelsmanbacteria bacterium]